MPVNNSVRTLDKTLNPSVPQWVPVIEKRFFGEVVKARGEKMGSSFCRPQIRPKGKYGSILDKELCRHIFH